MITRATVVGLLTLGLALFVAPWALEGQQPAGKVYRLGFLSLGGVPDSSVVTQSNLVPAALRELGYVEGRNLVVERRFADDKHDRLPGLARELVQLRPDVIVAVSTQAIQAGRDATATIPIVIIIAADPVARGLVASLPRPGGNVTGVSSVAETSLAGKRLQLLREAVPKASRIAVLASGSLATSVQLQEAQKAAEALRVKLVVVEVRDGNYDRAFNTMVAERADGIFVVMGPTFVRDQAQIIDRAVKHRLPTVFANRELVEAGGLMSYGGSLVDVSRRVAVYVDKIFRGARPANLPVEQATTFELALNLKTASAIGLTLPPSLVERADLVVR